MTPHHAAVAPASRIARIEYWPVDIPITDPFVVATGARPRTLVLDGEAICDSRRIVEHLRWRQRAQVAGGAGR